jgi:hypothetical protein
MNDNTIEIHFMHPRNSAMTLTADLSPQCTGQEALQELLLDADGKGPFLPPLPDGQVYELSVHRTQQAITPNMTFAQAGVINGDTIDVGQSAAGAFMPSAVT